MTDWRPILRGLYFVSPDGQVIDAAGTPVKPHRDPAGYLRVMLTANGHEYDERVYDLVKHTFAPTTDRARELVAVGFPAGDDRDDPWSADISRPTTTNMTEGHPLSGRSPWPANA